MKGVVIANCGSMGLDWERLSLSGYIEAMGAQDFEAPKQAEASAGLKRFMAAHGVIGNA